MKILKYIGISLVTSLLVVSFAGNSTGIGTSITTILGTDRLSDSRTTINTNIANLNADKIEADVTALTSLVTVGTLTTGTWSANTIATIKGGTGFTTYTTGDIIYSSASNVLSKLAIGSVNEVLTVVGGVPSWTSTVINEALDYDWTGHHTFTSAFFTLASTTNATTTTQHFTNIPTQGSGFAQLSLSATTTIFTTSGAYTKSTGAKTVEVCIIGAGGGGGSGEKNASPSSANGGGAGGGGGYSCSTYLASVLGATETVTIGTGGTGGASQTSNAAGIDGTAGGDTSFGTTVLLQVEGASPGEGGDKNTDGTADGGVGGTGNGQIKEIGGTGATNSAGGGLAGVSSSTGIAARGGGSGTRADTGSGGVGGGFTTNFVQAGGAAGTNGTNIAAGFLHGGVGGGGGGQAGGVAGDGGDFGGGGGGGGGHTGNSGAGGDGGDGVVIVTEFF